MVSPHPLVAEHSDQQQMYDALRRNSLWPHIAGYGKHIVSIYPSYKINDLNSCHRPEPQFFPASASLDFVATDIVGLFSEKMKELQYNLVISDRYSKLIRAILAPRTTDTPIAKIIINYWLLPYGILTYILINSGTQIISNCFATICILLGIK